MPPITVVAGSYEGCLVGYEVQLPQEGEEACSATQILAMPAHSGCIRAMACGGPLLATGGSDSAVGVFNLRTRREQGRLLQQEGGRSLNCLRFYSSTHMISAGDDGELCIWRTSDWECLTQMRGHRAAVHDVDIHPSGRLALSVAADAKLMLWNLLTGKCIYTSALDAPSRMVRWAPDGKSYAVGAKTAVLLFELGGSGAARALPHERAAPLSLAFVGDALLVSGGADAALRVWKTDSGSRLCSHANAHASRVKALEAVAPHFVVSASSDGELKIWRVRADTTRLAPLLTLSTSLRLTTIGVCTPHTKPADRGAAQAATHAAPAPAASKGDAPAPAGARGAGAARAKPKAKRAREAVDDGAARAVRASGAVAKRRVGKATEGKAKRSAQRRAGSSS